MKGSRTQDQGPRTEDRGTRARVIARCVRCGAEMPDALAARSNLCAACTSQAVNLAPSPNGWTGD